MPTVDPRFRGLPYHDGQDGRATPLFSDIKGFIQMTERLGDPKMREEYMAPPLHSRRRRQRPKLGPEPNMAEYLGCLIVEFTFFWLRWIGNDAKARNLEKIVIRVC